MNNDRLHILAAEQGLFLRADVLAEGLSDRQIKQRLRSGEWIRVRNGAYVPREVWLDATPIRRHQLMAIAVALKLGPSVALSHTSSAVMHGLDLWAAPLDAVHVTRLSDTRPRRQRDLIHHHGLCSDSDVAVVGGITMTTPARTVVDAGSLLSTESALVLADAALRLGLCSHEDLSMVHDRIGSWPGYQRLQVVTRMASALSGSAGESRARYFFYAHGFPPPLLQYEVRDRSGALVGIVDFAWPAHRLFVEFDGKIKYGALLTPGQTPTDVVFKEKRREDRIRELTGFRVVRITWADLEDPAALARRLRSLMDTVA
jgi:hypothetical protein